MCAPSNTYNASLNNAYDPAEIPWSEIAFTTTLWALRDWLALRHPDLRPPDVVVGR